MPLPIIKSQPVEQTQIVAPTLNQPKPPRLPNAKDFTLPPISSGATVPPEERDRLIIEQADAVGFQTPGDTNVVVASGGVQLRYNGYHISCERATFDRKNRIATVETSVVVNTGRQILVYDYLSINLRTRDFLGRQGRTIVPAQDVSATLLEPLRLSGALITRNRNITVSEEGFLTTCDFDLPHYRFGYRKATIIPNDRIALRDVALYFGDRIVFRLPYLSIPISERASQYNYFPLVGRTDEEGYFVKNAIAYSFGTLFPNIIRVDFLQKKGVGYGIDQGYQFGKAAAGSLILYTLNDRSRKVDNLSGRVAHQQKIGTVIATINSDFQNNSYNSVSASSKTQNTTINASKVLPFGTTGVSLNLSSSDYGTTNSQNTAYTLTQDVRFGTNATSSGTISLRLNGTQNNTITNFASLSSTGASTTTRNQSGRIDQAGDVRATGRFGLFDLELSANKNLVSHLTGNSASASSSFFGGTERLPDVTISTDSSRLKGLLHTMAARFSVGFAEFVEGSTKTVTDNSGTAKTVPVNITTNRLLFNLDTNPTPYKLTPRGDLTLRLSGGYRQSVYRYGETMQYILTGRSDLIQQLGRYANVTLNYGYLRPYGGTPLDFRLDSVGSYNNAGVNLNVNGPKVKLTLLTGYDIQRAQQSNFAKGIPRNPWQNLAVQLALRPSELFQTRFTTTYDINNGKFVDATNRVRIRLPQGFHLDTGERYDPQTHRFPQLTAVLETPLFLAGFRIAAQTSYNGINKKFDYKNFTLTRSYHDYEISLRYVDQPYGFRTERGFSLALKLKAFPDFQGAQTGQYGTALDTGTGTVF